MYRDIGHPAFSLNYGRYLYWTFLYATHYFLDSLRFITGYIRINYF